MAFCKSCGAELPESARFCRVCGTQVMLEAAFATAAEPTGQPRQVQNPVQAEYRSEQPQQRSKPEKQKKEQKEKKQKEKRRRIPATMSIGEYIGAIIVMSIPVVGFIFTIIWTCGGCRNQNKANLARAYLILSAIIVVLMVAAIVIMVTVFGFSMAELSDFVLM